MVVYRELSSLEKDLGVSAKTLYTLSNQIYKHYRNVKIPKGNGEFRELSVPDAMLKAVQTKIAHNLLAYEPVSAYAKAYRPGGSPLKNAQPHIGREMLLKMDIRHFFDHVYYPIVKENAFPAERYSESNRILLSLLCVYKDALPQGAPTSPAISNIIMRDFDDTVGAWCKQRGIAYTRYCDDMTFSGVFDHQEVKLFVKEQLRKNGFFSNDRKTTFVKNGQRKTVTGIVVNDRANIPSAYRRKLRQELYYCKTYGLSSHIARAGIGVGEQTYLHQLMGRVNYVLSVDAHNREMQEAKCWITDQMRYYETR